MDVFYQSLGDLLVDEAREVEEEVLLVAPFIKRDTLKRLLEPLTEMRIRVVTRWRLDELAKGASDLDVWELLQEGGQSLELLPSLHAKYYRFDGICLAGSANLTQAALGWRERSNLEFLSRFRAEDAQGFEQELSGCLEVTKSIYLRYRRLLVEYKETHPEVGQEERYSIDLDEATTEISESSDESWVGNQDWWTPNSRHPRDLYLIYAGEPERVTSVTWEKGQYDLSHFDLPEGLGQEGFEMQIAWQLLQKPVVREIDEFVETSRRFGAVRDYLRDLPCGNDPSFDATKAWQTLMRWLMYFLEDRYRRYEANYSEIFVREDGS